MRCTHPDRFATYRDAWVMLCIYGSAMTDATAAGIPHDRARAEEKYAATLGAIRRRQAEYDRGHAGAKS